jgi:predicted  nucleic acid-binding Zn-ribbon protein
LGEGDISMRGSSGTKWGTKIVLVLLAAACGAGAWYAKGQQKVVGADAEAAAAAESAAYIQENLTQGLKHRPSGDDPEKLRRFYEGLVPEDAVAMRLWRADGTLVFSSTADDSTTVAPALVSDVLADGEPVNAADATTLRTYAKAGELVGEIDQDADAVRGAVTLPWMVGEYGLFGVAIVLLGAALFAGRGDPAPKKRTDWGEKEEMKETKKELPTSDPELEKLRKKSEKAEGSRRAMEDQLNTLRSQLQSGDAGSQSRITELEGSLKDAHGRVTEAQERNADLTRRVAELEATAASAGPAVQRIAALETEVTAARSRTKELELQLTEVQARAALAETTASSHTGQLDEAQVKAHQAELQVSEAVDRASAAEREVGELRARLAAAESNGQGVDDQVRTLLDELAAAATITEERDRALREAQARAESAEQLLAAAEARATYAESLVLQAGSQAGSQPAQPDPWGQSADPLTEERVRELEIALADARAEAWAATPSDDRPSLGVVETHAVPEDEDVQPQVPQEVDEASAIRAELERMGQIVQHAGEAGDIDGLRGRLTKSAARKKGRAALDDGSTPP